MKKVLSGIIFIAVCLFSLSLTAQKSKVNGDGNISKKIRKVPSSFNKIIVESIKNVYLIQGEENSIRIEADSNLHQYIQTPVVNDMLIVKLKDKTNIKSYEKFNIYITFNNIEELFIKNGSVKFLENEKMLKLDTLKIITEKVGLVELNLDCSYLEAHLLGFSVCNFSGKTNEFIIKTEKICEVNAKEFIAEKVIIDNDAMCVMEIYADKGIFITGPARGNFTCYGNAVPEIPANSGSKNILKAE